MRRDEREAVAAFLGKAGERPGAAGRGVLRGPHGRASPARPKAQWNGWSPGDGQHAISTGGRGGSDRRAGAAPRAEVGVRLRGRRLRVRAADRHRRHVFVGSAGGARARARRRDRLPALGLPGERPGALGDDRVAAQGSRHALLFSDLTGWFYALDAATGKAALEEARRRARGDAADAARRRARRRRVRAGVARGKRSRAIGPGLPVLHVPRQHHGAARARRLAGLEDLHSIRDEPKPRGKSRVGTEQWGPSGAGVWATPTVDAQARPALRHDRRQLLHRRRPTTSDAVIALDLKTGASSGRSRRSPTTSTTPRAASRRTELSAEERARLTTSARRRCWSRRRRPRPAARRTEIRRRLRARSREERRDLWQTRVGKGGINGGVQWGMASDGQHVYAAVSDVVRIRRARTATRRSGALTLDPTRRRRPDRAARRGRHARSGSRRRRRARADGPAAARRSPRRVTAIPGVVFSGSIDGHLRAFSAARRQACSGTSTRCASTTTVNGVTATGGSLDGPGPVVVGGMVFVNSGYPRFGGMPGNVLLAFAPK